MAPGSWPFDLLDPLQYHTDCTSRERRVLLETESDRQLIQHNVMFMKGDKKYGLTISNNVAKFGLLVGDVLKPTLDLMDIRDFESVQLPFTLVFWRFTYDRNRRYGSTVHRNPLYDHQIGIYPQHVIAIDVMHTIFLGIIQRLISAIIWRVVLLNPWGHSGNKDDKQILALKNITKELREWQKSNNILACNRIHELTMKMMGSSQGDDLCHAADAMKLKAYESWVLLLFA